MSPRPQQNILQLYQPRAIPEVLNRLLPGWRSRQAAQQLTQGEQAMLNLAARLDQTSAMRLLRGLPPMWSKDLLDRQMRIHFPHFADVTERVQQAVALSQHAGCQLQVPPMLLLGDPGLGKTFYARMLSHVLRLEYRFVSMSTATAGFILSGIDSRWSESKPGLIFSQLVEGDTGNPLFLLDEIDKASGWDSRTDALSPLYGLLEGHTARHFEDEYFPLPLDASQVQWIATANDLSMIPSPIQSRVEVFEIPPPTLEQRRALVPIIYAHLLADRPWGSVFDGQLNPELAAEIAERHKTPREIRKALEAICGRIANRTQALPIGVQEEGEKVDLYPTLACLPEKKAVNRRFGFSPGLGMSGTAHPAEKRMR